jgi:hypothetical protein
MHFWRNIENARFEIREEEGLTLPGITVRLKSKWEARCMDNHAFVVLGMADWLLPE